MLTLESRLSLQQFVWSNLHLLFIYKSFLFNRRDFRCVIQNPGQPIFACSKSINTFTLPAAEVFVFL